MTRFGRMLKLLFFMLRFLVLAVVLVAAWWSLIPIYGHVLVQASGAIARFAFGVPVTGVAVSPVGILNTESTIHFFLANPGGTPLDRALPVALLVTNLVPYLALVLASTGLSLRRRLWVLVLGTSIIVGGHIIYVAVLLAFQNSLQQMGEIVTAVLQFFLILPFLLWIWLVYSERIAAFLAEDDDAPQDTK